MNREPRSGNRPALALAMLLAALVLSLSAIDPTELRAYPQQDAPRRSELLRRHDASNFPLVGAHRRVECGDCHLQGVLAGTPTDCQSCHWGRRQDDPYRLQLGVQCGDCHSEQAWGRLLPGSWDHAAVTGFPLEGRHRTVDCTSCHPAGRLTGTVTECSACHLEDFRATREPDHTAAGFPLQCEVCHRSSQWLGADFDHSLFPLVGRHGIASCSDCHANGIYAGLPSACIQCHRADYQATASPNHLEARFPVDCEACHGVSFTSWRGATFDHDAVFPLTGRHRTAACSDCHRNGVFAGTPTVCIACHEADYRATTLPNHLAAGFDTTCEMCHDPSAVGWLGASFDHAVFPLIGGHSRVDCVQCHASGQFAGTTSVCVACHEADYHRTNHPDHGALDLSDDCQLCHGNATRGWRAPLFTHDAFALNGRHRAIDCNACHRPGSALPTDCVGCHFADYQATGSPPHQAAGLGTDCESCHGHSARSWNDAATNFLHAFPIDSGKHNHIPCSDCHFTSNFREFSCIDCHTHRRNVVEAIHQNVNGFIYMSQACLGCHPDGMPP